MKSPASYPIIEERPFKPAQRRFGLFARRDVGELPNVPVGAVMVFEVHGGYHAFTERRHLKGTEEAVVEAVSVSVVDVRNRTVPVTVDIPSADLGYSFTVKALFKCQAVNPEAVVAGHIRDVGEHLADHLRADIGLMQLGKGRRIEEINDLVPAVCNRIQAYLEFTPPEIDGMEIGLPSVDLVMPDDVVEHGKGMKQVEWGGQIKELRAAIENRDVERLVHVFQGGLPAAMALGISRQELLMPDAAAMIRDREEQQVKNMFDFVRQLPSSTFDFVPIDTRHMLNELTSSQFGIELFPDHSAPRQLGPAESGHGGPRAVGLEDVDE
ncbi:hypothetical protein ABZ897_07775 [Nonomuraea sp. NPDC046802]|uniref:hypothetical protein n=1 Tax=Nonomuraea sp. NPDC046802 TaxID=3154919 RepID=UPI0033EBA4A6